MKYVYYSSLGVSQDDDDLNQLSILISCSSNDVTRLCDVIHIQNGGKNPKTNESIKKYMIPHLEVWLIHIKL